MELMRRVKEAKRFTNIEEPVEIEEPYFRLRKAKAELDHAEAMLFDLLEGRG